MKKFLTFAVFAGTFVPALQSMNINLPTDTQKTHNELVALIQTADNENFKNKFDALTLTPEHHTVLKQIVAETKTAITKELEATGNSNKNWFEIAKGSLAGLCGLSSAWLALFVTYSKVTGNYKYSYLITFPAFPAFFIISEPTDYLLNQIEKVFKTSFKYHNEICHILLPSVVAYKTLPYAKKTIKNGWNYKEHLQTMLVNLDAIDAHIAQAKA